MPIVSPAGSRRTPFQRTIGAGFLLAAFVLAGLCNVGAAQGTKADYERAAELPQRFKNKLIRDRVEPHWISPTRFWYAAPLGETRREYVLVDAERGERKIAFDHAAVAAALAAAIGADSQADQLNVQALLSVEAGVQIKIEEHWYHWRDRQLQPLDDPPNYEELDPWTTSADEPEPPGGKANDRSPEGRWRVERALGAGMLRDTESKSVRSLAAAPVRDGGFDAPFWSPDSKYLVLPQRVPGDQRIVHLIESAPTDQLQPKLHEHQYDKPGDNVPHVLPRLFSVENAAEIPIDNTLFPTPWSIGNLRWKPDGSAFTFVYNERGHQTVRLIEVDAGTGAARSLVEETSPTFVHYSGGGKCWLYRLDDSNEALWTSERDGWNHLYRVDLASGQLHQITRGPWVVRGIDHVDANKRQIWFRASGIHAHQNPYYVHHCRVDFDGSNQTVLTEAPGDHRVRWSPDGRWLIATHSRVDLPPVNELREAANGSLICELEKADASALIEAGWRAPERFVAKGRDGKTDIYGILCRPTNFDPATKYPVIEEHYAGPHASHCPRRFSVNHRSQQWADLGFIVVQLDGMGTDHRGKAFHDVCWQNLSDAGFPDRIAWLRAAAEHEPAIDLARVGIRGTSAGGQTGMAALWRHSDFYKVCVSNCGCHDNRTDKVWWNEQWMGYPIGPHYAEQSNVVNAHRVSGDLLLIVGELDRNVPPTATLQVVDALIRADKDFDFLFVPGAGHGARHPVSTDYTVRRTWDFFVRKLHGVEPRRADDSMADDTAADDTTADDSTADDSAPSALR